MSKSDPSPNKKVVEALNEVLTAELTAINQYFLHSKMCGHWGFERLRAKAHDESIGEMKHADELIERILFLEGVPNVQRLGKIKIGETAPEQFRVDLALEREGVPRLRAAIEVCLRAEDHTSRRLLEKILAAEEDHIEWLESQLGLIDTLGESAYLAQQLH